MRAVKSFSDVQIALRDLQDWQVAFPKQDLDMHGYRVINTGDAQQATDVAIQQQLPTVVNVTQTQKSLYYTIVYSNSGLVSTGDLIPDFDIGWGREGSPLEVWLDAQGKPDGTEDAHSLIVNINLITYKSDGSSATLQSILKNDLKITTDDYIPLLDSMGNPILNTDMTPKMECKVISTRTMIDPLPKFGRYSKVRPVIVNGGNASTVSIGVVVQILGT